MSDGKGNKPTDRNAYGWLLAVATVLTAGAAFLKEIVELIRTLAGG